MKARNQANKGINDNAEEKHYSTQTKDWWSIEQTLNFG